MEWLIRAQNGDEEAFTMLVTTYQNPVYNLCYRMLGDSQEAEDAAQETFWRAYQAICRYDRSRPFATWLLSIAAHYCIDQHRKRRLPILEMDDWMEELLPANTPNLERSVSQSQEDEMLHRMMKGMNPQDRAVLILRYWYEFSEEEISRALHISVSAVKSRLYRARLRMAELWQSAHTPPAERIRDESPAY